MGMSNLKYILIKPDVCAICYMIVLFSSVDIYKIYEYILFSKKLSLYK